MKKAIVIVSALIAVGAAAFAGIQLYQKNTKGTVSYHE